jgi:hypothetical protein
MKFGGISLGTSRFDEIWEEGSCLHLEDNSTLEREFGVSNYDLLGFLLRI